MVCCLILSCSQPFLNMFPCRGRQNECQRNKDQNTLHAGGSCVAATLLLITSSGSAHLYLCTHNARQLLRRAHATAYGFFRSVCFCSKNESSVWLRCAEQHTSQGRFVKAARRLAYLGRPDVPKKRDCKRLIDSEEWRNSFVLLKNLEYRSIVRVGLR